MRLNLIWRLPDSSVLATTVAFQYLSQVKDGANTDLVRDGIRYLLSTYDSQTNQWFNLPPVANEHARAPWWDYETSKTSDEWGNPSAEILGYLTKYQDVVEDKQLLQVLFDKAKHRLESITDPEPHEIKCYLRLYENSSPEFQKQLHEPLARIITKVTKTNTGEWSGYIATPLTFIDSPQHPFAYLFDSSLLSENTNFLINQMKGNDHWEPTWSWGDQSPDEWLKAKSEWSGKISVEYY